VAVLKKYLVLDSWLVERVLQLQVRCKSVVVASCEWELEEEPEELPKVGFGAKLRN
jgi:hypothetical protein